MVKGKSDLDAMIQRAFTKREERLRKIFEENRRFEDYKKARNSKRLHKLMSRFMSIPIIIGVSAAIILGWVYGTDQLVQTLLSWTIGLTILATTVALLEKYGRFF